MKMSPSFLRIIQKSEWLVYPLPWLIFVFCSTEKDYLPGHLADLTQVRRLEGKEAEAFVNRLHMKSVTSPQSEIGFYQGENGSATFYVAHYLNRSEAQEEWNKMTRKISPENSVFIGGEIFDFNGKQIYRCFGMGQTHFVFTHRNRLLWLSVNTMKAKDILEKYLAYLD